MNKQIGGFGSWYPDKLPEGYESMNPEEFMLAFTSKNGITLAPEGQRDDPARYKKRMIKLCTGITEEDYWICTGARQ